MHLDAPQPFKLDVGWLQDQAFRWSEPHDDGWLYGVIWGYPVKVRQTGSSIEVHGPADVREDRLAPEVVRYFRLDEDIAPVHDALKQDAKLAPLVEEHGHIRVLRQNAWECLVAYACSANNSVKRITEILEKLASEYGEHEYLDGGPGGTPLYALPSCHGIFAGREQKLHDLDLGLRRADLLWTLAIDVAEDFLDLNSLTLRKYEQARRMLRSYDGIGSKIADCVCLFSLDKPQAFPVDRNIRDALHDLYPEASGLKGERLAEWARDRWGSNAGYVGQLLFQHQRPKKK